MQHRARDALPRRRQRRRPERGASRDDQPDVSSARADRPRHRRRRGRLCGRRWPSPRRSRSRFPARRCRSRCSRSLVVLAGLCARSRRRARRAWCSISLAGALGLPVFSPIGAPGLLRLDRPHRRLPARGSRRPRRSPADCRVARGSRRSRTTGSRRSLASQCSTSAAWRSWTLLTGSSRARSRDRHAAVHSRWISARSAALAAGARSASHCPRLAARSRATCAACFYTQMAEYAPRWRVLLFLDSSHASTRSSGLRRGDPVRDLRRDALGRAGAAARAPCSCCAGSIASRGRTSGSDRAALSPATAARSDSRLGALCILGLPARVAPRARSPRVTGAPGRHAGLVLAGWLRCCFAAAALVEELLFARLPVLGAARRGGAIGALAVDERGVRAPAHGQTRAQPRRPSVDVVVLAGLFLGAILLTRASSVRRVGGAFRVELVDGGPAARWP